MKKICLIAFCILILSAGCSWMRSPAPAPVASGIDARYNRQLNIGGKILNMQIVTTPAEMEQGLSSRLSMEDNQGMLFDFGTSTLQDFWMKDMEFNLDFIWIKNNTVIGITPNVPVPEAKAENLPTYSPPSPVDKVVEVNAGWAEKNKIKTGDKVIEQN